MTFLIIFYSNSMLKRDIKLEKGTKRKREINERERDLSHTCPASIAPQEEEEEENRDTESKNHLEKKTATTCCSIFGRLGDCLLKYCSVAVGLERGTEWQ